MRYERYYCTWNIVARSIFECLRFLPRKNKKPVIEDKITFISQVIIVNRLCYFSYTEFFILRLVNEVISNKYKSRCKQYFVMGIVVTYPIISFNVPFTSIIII